MAQPGHVRAGASLLGPGQQPPASGPQREQSLQPSDLATQQSQGPGLRTSALRTAQVHEDRVPRSLPSAELGRPCVWLQTWQQEQRGWPRAEVRTPFEVTWRSVL